MGHRLIRKYYKEIVLPPLRDLNQRPEVGNSIRSRLCRLLTSPENQPPAKGLLSGIFGNSATTATTTATEKFSFGSSQPFTFGQEKKSDSSASKESAATAASGFSFGSTGPTTSGFTFGSATGAGSTFGSR